MKYIASFIREKRSNGYVPVWKDAVHTRKHYVAPDYKNRVSTKYTFKDAEAFAKFIAEEKLWVYDADSCGDCNEFIRFDTGECFKIEHIWWWNGGDDEDCYLDNEFRLVKIEKDDLPDNLKVGDRDWI